MSGGVGRARLKGENKGGEERDVGDEEIKRDAERLREEIEQYRGRERDQVMAVNQVEKKVA